MSQSTYTIGANQSGTDYRTQDNAGKMAITSNHKGSSRPSYALAGMMWVDDSASPTHTLKYYDGADDITVGTINTTSNVFSAANAILANGANNYFADAQASDAYVITPAPAYTAYFEGMELNFKPNTVNTGACTINVNGLGEKNIKVAPNYRDPLDGDLKAGMIHKLIYNSTQNCFVLMNTAKTRIGELVTYSGSTAPKGTLPCNGAAVSRTTYADLFSQTSTEHGVGDGSTTFNVPELSGRSPMGDGTGSGLTARTAGVQYGSETETPTIAKTAPHTHPTGDITNFRASGALSGSYATTGGTSGSTGSGTNLNIMDPKTAVKFAIIYQ